MKVDIGGGHKPKKGFKNLDRNKSADIIHDLDETPWPIGTNTVTEIYSSHCFEHLKDPTAALKEVARICVAGTRFELRVPHPNSEVAMIPGHIHVISETYLVNALHHFPDGDWKDIGKILHLEGYSLVGDPLWLPRARQCRHLQNWKDTEIMEWIPRTCFETRFQLRVKNFED